MWRCEGPHCFVQKRPRPFVSALQSIAAVEASKNQILRDFRYRSIFDFCNTICQNRTHAERCRSSPCVIATTIHPQREASPAPVGRNVYNSAMLTALFDKVGIDLLCGDNVCTAAVLVSV